MRGFSGDTDSVHENDLISDIRAYVSASAVRLREDVWLCIDTRWVADGTPAQITIYCEDDDGAQRQALGSPMSATIQANHCEQKWRVDIPQSSLDKLDGAIYLEIEARLDGHPLPARSQRVLVHRTRFSS